MYLREQNQFGDVTSAALNVANAVANPISALSNPIGTITGAVKSLGKVFGIGPAPADQAAWASFDPAAHFLQTITNNKTTAGPAAAAAQIGTTVDSAVKAKNAQGITYQAPYPFTVRIGVRDPARVYNGTNVVTDLAPPGPQYASQAAQGTLQWIDQFAKQTGTVPAAGAAVPPTPAAQQTPAVPAATDLTSLLSRLFTGAPSAAPASTTVTVAPGGSAPAAAAPIQAGMPGWLLPVVLGGALLFVTQSNQSTGRRR